MYTLGKIIQALALTIVLIGFIRTFPRLMNPRVFMFGLMLFIFGWMIHQFMARPRR